MPLAAALLFAVGSAAGATGALDPSFGVRGTVTTGLVGPEGVSPANALLLQPDGKIVAVGDSEPSPEDVPDTTPSIALVRYDPDGSQDASFGSDGVVTTTISGGALANAAVLQPDGKIVVAGYTWPEGPNVFALVRYNPDGSLDSTFGSGGIVTTPVGDGDSEAFGVVLQPDGKIVAGGGATTGSNGAASALARYLPDGSLDTSFGTDGIVLDTQTGENGFAAIALQPDGKILGVGQSSSTVRRIDWTTTPLTRFNSDGTLDSSFGSGGVSDAPIGPAAALALQPDGKIVVAGEKPNSFAVSRVDLDGTADPSFGSGGTVTTPMGAGVSSASAVALQPDAKIVVAGTSQGGFTVARYNPDGSLDPTFGSGGIVTTLSTAGSYWAGAGVNSVALHPDGKIDAAGWSYFAGETGEQLSLARYLGSGGGMLTVQKLGTGTGSVTSDPVGVDCGVTCRDLFAPEPVTLTATPAAGSVFTGWSGACSGRGTCQVQMSTDRSVSATFSLAPQMLTVAKSGTGSGTITSSPAGIGCGSGCSHAYAYGTTVTLTARAGGGSTFKGWSGACSGTGNCSVAMKQAQSATARFAHKPACIVPKVKGRSLTTARRMVKRAHCRTGTIRHRYSKVKKGHVISQKPRAKTHLRNEARINLVISKGKRP